MKTAREMTHTEGYFAKSRRRKDILNFPDLPTPGTGTLQTIPHPRTRRAGLAGRGGGGGLMVTGQIGPCIIYPFIGIRLLVSVLLHVNHIFAD